VLRSHVSAVTVLPPSRQFGLQTLKLATQSSGGGLDSAGVPLVSPVPRQGVQVFLDLTYESVVQLVHNPSDHLLIAM
jgi:hypothetical protein